MKLPIFKNKGVLVVHQWLLGYLNKVVKVSSRTLRSKLDCNLLTVPRSHHDSGDRSFQVYGPTVWNGLPADVRACRELYPFKKLLKTAFYRRAFNCNWLLMLSAAEPRG